MFQNSWRAGRGESSDTMPVFHTKTIESILDPVAQQVSRLVIIHEVSLNTILQCLNYCVNISNINIYLRSSVNCKKYLKRQLLFP